MYTYPFRVIMMGESLHLHMIPCELLAKLSNHTMFGITFAALKPSFCDIFEDIENHLFFKHDLCSK
jgi:hypothetical protein